MEAVPHGPLAVTGAGTGFVGAIPPTCPRGPAMPPPSARLRSVAPLIAGVALAAALAVACVTPPPPPHVANPFVGATNYVSPDYARLVDTSIARTTDPTLRAR